MAPKVSVIVPVYSGAEHLASLLQNLQNQTLQGMEFLFVDDCGPDNTFSIAEQAAKGDSRIVLIHNPHNMGPGASRNTGIKAASGEYIAFADSDDILPPDFYTLLYQKAKETNALVVKGRRVSVTEAGKQTASALNNRIRQQLLKGAEPVNAFTYEHTTAIYKREHVLANHACNGVARQDEDTVFILKAMHNITAEQFCITDDAVYYYRQHAESLTHVEDSSYLTDTLTSMRDKIDFLLQQEPAGKYDIYAADMFELLLRHKFEQACASPLITTPELVCYIQAVHTGLKQYQQQRQLTTAAYYTALMRDNILSPELYVNLCTTPPAQKYSKLRHCTAKLLVYATFGELKRQLRVKEFSIRAARRKR